MFSSSSKTGRTTLRSSSASPRSAGSPCRAAATTVCTLSRCSTPSRTPADCEQRHADREAAAAAQPGKLAREDAAEDVVHEPRRELLLDGRPRAHEPPGDAPERDRTG